MPLPGGPADKFGIRFEGRWTVACMLDIMDERANSMRLEPPGSEGAGVEFWVRKGDVCQYHQVKRQHSSGRWTVADLDQEGVLTHFRSKLGDEQTSCVFVSIHAASQLDELADRARRAKSWEEFDQEFLRADVHRKAFDRLCQAFGDPAKPEVYQNLKHIKVETVSENYLQTTVESRLWTLVEGDPSTAADVLAEFALEKVNHELTAPDIWHHLEARGFRRRRLDNDPHTLLAVEHANNRYLDSLRSQAISEHILPRDEVHTALNLLTSSDGKRGVMLTGEAGVGKSGVMLQVEEELLSRGLPTIAFRVDRLLPTQLPDNVGEQLGLPGSPANVLAAVSQGKDSVLVIDQLDALSLVSGRNAEIFDCIDAIIRQAQSHPNIHILLACRKFDLDNDYRLRRFTRNNDGFADTVTVNRLSDQTVRDVVSGFGLDASRLDARRLALLSVPLHLKLLSEIANDSSNDALNFETVQDLYEHFWRYKQRVIERERLGRPVQWTKVIYALCDYMHEHQRLTAPEVLVEEWNNDADAMASENVLVFDNNQYAFFHEGFFDYAYARRFAGGSQKLLALLLSDEQHLFRRAQVRQILLYLRETDFPRYITDLADVMASPDVRFHIKQVVFALLAELTSPAREEWEVLSQLLDRNLDDPSRRHTWSMVRNSVFWFELVDSLGHVEKWLADPNEELVDQTIWLLSGVQRKSADRVADLVEPYVGRSEPWKNRLLYLAQWADLSQGRRFMDLFLRLLDEGILDEARGPVAVNSDFWSLLYSLATQRPDWTSEAIGHYLTRRLALSLASGQPNPFDSQSGTIKDSQADDHVLVESARGAPADFIREILPFMLQVMDLTAERAEGPPWPDVVWGYRFHRGGHGIEHALLKAMETALSELVKRKPSILATTFGSLRDSSFETAQFLVIRAFTACGEAFAEEAVAYVCESPKRLAMGYMEDLHWAGRELIQAVTPHCSEEKLAQLEATLLEYYPEWEKTREGRRSFGAAQFALLSGINAARRSERVALRLQELERKFGSRRLESPELVIKSGWVGPPVPAAAASKMTDEHWLKAIAQYKADRGTPQRRAEFVGGAYQLAQLLESQVKQEPERFANLLLEFPDDTNSAYFDAVLRGIVDAGLDTEVVLKICERCHKLLNRPCGRWVSDCLAKLAEEPSPKEALDIVAWYATKDPDPEEEQWRTRNSSGSTYSRDILTQGINTVRGTAAEAISAFISHDAGRIPHLRPALDRMVQDPSIAVRSCVARALLMLLRHDRDLAVSLFQRLCDTEDALLSTLYVERFLYFALQTHFSSLSQILERTVTSQIPEVATTGARQACLASLELEEAQPLAQLCLSGTKAQRIGAAQVMAANVKTARFRQFCEGALINQFNDDEEEVRREAAECFSHFEGEELTGYTVLAQEFIESRAFPSEYHYLLQALERTTARITEIICLACERFIDVAGAEAGDIRTRHAGEANIVVQLILQAYQQSSDKTGQAKSLDIIDRLLEFGVYSIDRAMETFER